MATIKMEQLNSEINKILDKYGDDVADDVKKASQKAGKQAVKELKAVNHFAPHGHVTGAYSRSWSSKTEEKRGGVKVTVYNKKHYRLTHLLEHGHAKRGGGRVPAYVHIKPVEEEVADNVVKEIRRRVQK